MDTAQSIYTASWSYTVATCSQKWTMGESEQGAASHNMPIGTYSDYGAFGRGGILKGFKWFQGCHPIFNSSKIKKWTEKGSVVSLLMCYQSITWWPLSFHKVWKLSDDSQSFKCCLAWCKEGLTVSRWLWCSPQYLIQKPLYQVMWTCCLVWSLRL